MRTIETFDRIELTTEDKSVAKSALKWTAFGAVAFVGSKTVGACALGYAAAKVAGHVGCKVADNIAKRRAGKQFVKDMNAKSNIIVKLS